MNFRIDQKPLRNNKITGVKIFIDDKILIDATNGYIDCSKVNFDSNTKTIILS